MQTFQIVALTFALLALALTLCWLDKTYHWRLVDWFNGKVSNPFTSEHVSASERSKDEQIAALKSRIETLEAIVTEPSYELNKKINAL
ncbi:hypothetical protein [Alteromonas facilis]|uniref:hypothetical protein n=1 Tax=Alteromonas facilis TaxID=2048004 RepID=UPI000C285D3B|nr:hypothetical protein [Alteromonas facilis]